MWMLNHATLRGAEVEFLRDSGLEVFTPKVIPATGFRSGDVTYEYDDSLTIPADALEALNSFDFFSDPWTDEIRRVINAHFDMIMVMPMGESLPEALRHFDGLIVLRVFGTYAHLSYSRVLSYLYGMEMLDLLVKRADDFVFGQAYANLSEVEPAYFRGRTITLPITLPRHPNLDLPLWTGNEARIATLCPDIADTFNSRWYLRFMEELGDLPHLVLGSQTAPIRDRNVLGRVSWDRFGRELSASRAFFYISREPRHVHYTPFEAAQIGEPVVFFDDSLFGDLCTGVEAGRIRHWSEGRELLLDLLHSDPEVSRALHAQQQPMATALAWANHVDDWRKALLQLSTWREHGPAFGVAPQSSSEVLRYAEAGSSTGGASGQASVIQHLSFVARDEALPEWLTTVVGLDEPELWGRWSTHEVVTIMFASPIEGLVRVSVDGMPFDEHVGRDLTVRIGDEAKSARVGAGMAKTPFVLRVNEPTDRVELAFPVSSERIGGQRHLGFALARVEITIAPAEFETVGKTVHGGDGR